MRRRRAILILIGGTFGLALLAGAMPSMIQEGLQERVPTVVQPDNPAAEGSEAQGSAMKALNELQVKGRAPKTGYERTQFGNGWAKVNGCGTRDIILYRDLTNVSLDGECIVRSGTLDDPYTGEIIQFNRSDSDEVQIDHVIALSDAWQKGAQQLSIETRKRLANDPLELIAVSGKANQQKSDGDAATWLPENKAFRCAYIARQIAVKQKYSLWVTEAEKNAMASVLEVCPMQALP